VARPPYLPLISQQLSRKIDIWQGPAAKKGGEKREGNGRGTSLISDSGNRGEHLWKFIRNGGKKGRRNKQFAGSTIALCEKRVSKLLKTRGKGGREVKYWALLKSPTLGFRGKERRRYLPKKPAGGVISQRGEGKGPCVGLRLGCGS